MIERIRAALGKRTFLKHVLTLMSGTALAQALPILASPIVSRLYSPHEMGIYTAFMSLVAAMVTIATLRYDLAIVLPAKAEDARALVKIASSLNVASCLAMGAVLLIFAKPVSALLNAPELAPWLVVVPLVACVTAQAAVFGYWCNRTQRYGLLARNRIGQAVTSTTSQIGMGALSFGAAGLIFSTFFGQIFSTLNLWWRNRDDLRERPMSSRKAMLKEHRKMPLLNAPTAVLDSVRTNGVQLMIQAYFSSAALGQFGQAWRLLQTPASLINSSLSQVFYQRLTTIRRGELLFVVRRSIVRSAVIGIVPFLLLYLLSPWVFPFVFGARWAPAGLIGQALVPWLYLNFITSPISTVFVVTRRQGTLFWFGLPMTALPLMLIWQYHGDILASVTALGWIMAGLLGVFLLLALWVSWGFDRKVGQSPAAGETGDQNASSDEQTGDDQPEALSGPPGSPHEG